MLFIGNRTIPFFPLAPHKPSSVALMVTYDLTTCGVMFGELRLLGVRMATLDQFSDPCFWHRIRVGWCKPPAQMSFPHSHFL